MNFPLFRFSLLVIFSVFLFFSLNFSFSQPQRKIEPTMNIASDSLNSPISLSPSPSASSNSPLHRISSLVKISRFYRSTDQIDPNFRSEILILLKQRNLDELNRRFNSISDPNSPEYGHFMNAEDIRRLVAPPAAEVQKVVDWLNERRSEAQKADIQGSNNPAFWTLEDRGDSIHLSSNLATIEFLFRAKMKIYENSERPQVKIARLAEGSSAFIPKRLMNVVEFIVGLGDFPPHLVHGPVRSSLRPISSRPQNPTTEESTAKPEEENPSSDSIRSYYDSLIDRRLNEAREAAEREKNYRFSLHHDESHEEATNTPTEADFAENPRINDAASLRDLGEIAKNIGEIEGNLHHP